MSWGHCTEDLPGRFKYCPICGASRAGHTTPTAGFVEVAGALERFPEDLQRRIVNALGQLYPEQGTLTMEQPEHPLWECSRCEHLLKHHYVTGHSSNKCCSLDGCDCGGFLPL